MTGLKIEELTLKEKLSYIKRLEIKEVAHKFATEYHRNTSGHKLRFDTFLHMVDLYDDGPLFKDIVIMGGTQIGKTDWLIVNILAAAYCGLNVFYVLPHNKMRDKYVQEKILRPIKSCPEYKEIKKQAIADSVEQMEFGKGMIKFVSANVTAEMTSFSADILVVDETDQINKASLPNLELGMGRLDGSSYQFTRLVSNPSSEDGYISDKYDKTDKRVRKCPCDKCGVYSELNWFKTVVEEIKNEDGEVINVVLRDKEWFPGIRRDIHIKCPEPGCDGNIQRFDPSAYWEPTAFSEQGIVGFHMPSIISHSTQVSKLWFEFKDARDSPAKMQAFYARRLALPYSKQGHKVSVNVLKRCADDEEYNFELHSDCAYSTYSLHDYNKNKRERDRKFSVMGVDVSPTHLDISIATVEPNYQKLIYVGKNDPDSVAVLLDLIERYYVKVATIDIGPERLFANEFQEKAPCPVWKCKYKGAGDDRDAQENYNDMIYVVDRTEALDESYSQYKQGRILLPFNFKEVIDGVWAEEMQALSRSFTEDSKGRLKVSWTGSNEDHSRHADAYRHISYKLSQQGELTDDDIYLG